MWPTPPPPLSSPIKAGSWMGPSLSVLGFASLWVFRSSGWIDRFVQDRCCYHSRSCSCNKIRYCRWSCDSGGNGGLCCCGSTGGGSGGSGGWRHTHTSKVTPCTMHVIIVFLSSRRFVWIVREGMTARFNCRFSCSKLTLRSPYPI